MTARRSARTSRERGAAIFVVLMITTLLTAIGVFAVRTTSMVERGVGFARKGSQAFYISEFALRNLVTNYERRPQSSKRPPPVPNDCVTVAAMRDDNANQVVHCDVVDQRWGVDQLNPTLQLAGELGNPGGFIGTTQRAHNLEATADLAPEYRIELTEVGPAPRPVRGQRTDGEDLQLQQTTVTVFGRIRPDPDGAFCSAASTQAASQMVFRAFITNRESK